MLVRVQAFFVLTSDLRLLISGVRLSIIGDGIEQPGFTHAFAFIVDNDPAGGFAPLEADQDGSLGQMARGFEAKRFKREGIVGPHVTFILDVKQLVVGLVERKETHAAAVQGKAVQRTHTEDGMGLGVVMFLDPRDELAVECLQ